MARGADNVSCLPVAPVKGRPSFTRRRRRLNYVWNAMGTLCGCCSTDVKKVFFTFLMFQWKRVFNVFL